MLPKKAHTKFIRTQFIDTPNRMYYERGYFFTHLNITSKHAIIVKLNALSLSLSNLREIDVPIRYTDNDI